jgi:enoyl-CoA hydratase/carnithine racemase
MNPSIRVTDQEPADGIAPSIRLDRDGPVATLTLCRPAALNALTAAMFAELSSIGRGLPGDVRVVVVRGEGRAFCAGIDLELIGARSGAGVGAGMSPADAEARILGFQQAFSWLRRPDLVSIAAVHGFAIGAGLQLALACDLRVLADDARLVMAETGLGLVPDLGGTRRLVELVGSARAMELCLTSRQVTAGEAERIGLANVTAQPEHLDDAVRDLVGAVLAPPRDAVVEVKALLAAASLRDFPAQEAAERAAQARRIADLAGRGE